MKPKMKAYIARELDEWICTLVHGETPGQAKTRAIGHGALETAEYLDVRLTRLPGLDDKPITFENAKSSGFEYVYEDGSEPIPENEFTNECGCEICRPHKKTGLIQGILEVSQ